MKFTTGFVLNVLLAGKNAIHLQECVNYNTVQYYTTFRPVQTVKLISYVVDR